MQINFKKIILSSLLIIWTVYGWGQIPQASYELFTSESGNNKTYVARDYVSLKPGFNYSATSNTSFTAKIDAGLLFPPTENTYMTSTGGFTNNPSEGAVVGNIPGAASVNTTGGATYQIPIEVPAGVNGMHPNISLVYNSQTGNGIAGWGWNISGISSINTIPRTIFSDNATTGFNLHEYNYLQKFALDGNSLILESGSTGTKTYITENKSYTKIVNDNTKFIVTTKEGTIMEYAQIVSPQKTSTSQLTPGAIQWMLTKVTDSNGNYMIYSYKSNNSNTQIVLDKVEYTGNGSILPSVKVQFGYEEKAVKQKQYIEGYYLEDFYLLKNITINTGLVQLRKYDFIHNNSMLYL